MCAEPLYTWEQGLIAATFMPPPGLLTLDGLSPAA